MSNFYVDYFIENDDIIFKSNTKTFAVCNFIRISAIFNVVISGFIYKVIILIKGNSILKVMKSFRENQQNHELKVILTLHFKFN